MKTKTVKEKSRAEKGGERRQTCVISFRVGVETRLKLQELADDEGCSLGEFARDVLEGGDIKGRQLEIPFEDEEEEDEERDPEIDLEAFLREVASSAKGLARGWVTAKLLPKIRSKRGINKTQEQPAAETTKLEGKDGPEWTAWFTTEKGASEGCQHSFAYSLTTTHRVCLLCSCMEARWLKADLEPGQLTSIEKEL